MTSIEVTAPAKVNLYLKVLNKRKDSYHNILTLFERISLADRIKISKIDKGIVVSSDKFITRSSRDNLAYHAAELISNYKKLKCGVKIEIEKNIPVAAGLGGGSSDAAAVLIGINRLFDLKLKKSVLMRLAKRIGADVSFFILNKPFALGRSRGDRLKAVDLKPRFWHLIIYPGFGLSTKAIYKAFDRRLEFLSNPSTGSGFDPELLPKGLTTKPDDVKIKIPLESTVDLRTLEEMLHNDLEDIVLSKKEIIGKIIERLASILGKKAILSGSGPSLFCLYKTRKEVTGARRRFLESTPVCGRKNWQTFIVKTC